MKIVTRFSILGNLKNLVVYACHIIKIGSRYTFRYNFRYNFFTSESGPRATAMFGERWSEVAGGTIRIGSFDIILTMEPSGVLLLNPNILFNKYLDIL